jgi:hypothetical protein
MMRKISRKSWKMSFAICSMTIGAFVNPKGMTIHSNAYTECEMESSTYLSVKYRQNFYAPLRSISVKFFAPPMCSQRLEI